MVTQVSEAIIDLLTAERVDLIARSLGYCSSFRCPDCGNYGNADREPTGAVLYRKIGLAGGFSSDYSDDGFRPDEPTLVQWWLARTHRGCESPPLRSWSQLPSWAATPAAGTAAAVSGGPGCQPGEDAAAPAHVWLASVTPTGLAVLRWQQAVPIAHVIRVDDERGVGEERLVDVVTETMADRGARRLADHDLLLDAVTDLWPLDDWYCHLADDGHTTIWMPAAVRDDLALRMTGTDPQTARAPLCRLGPLPPRWLATARSQRRMLLAMTPPAIDREYRYGGRQSRVLYQPVMGGIMTAATAADRDRHTIAPARPRRCGPAAVPAAPVDLDRRWDAAIDRASPLVEDYRREHPHRWRRLPVDPVQLIALVLAAVCRHDDIEPDQVPLIDVARRLAVTNLDLSQWLQIMLQPTTLAERLRHAEMADPFDLRTSANCRPFTYLREQARTAVDRQRLIDAGGLRLCDEVRVLPRADAEKQTVRHGLIQDVSALAYCGQEPPPGWDYILLDVEMIGPGGSPVPREISDHDLLLADDRDPRAVAQAAHSALRDLRLWWPAPTLPGRSRADLRRIVHARAAHHTNPHIRDLLAALHTSPDGEFDDVLLATAAQLRALMKQ